LSVFRQFFSQACWKNEWASVRIMAIELHSKRTRQRVGYEQKGFTKKDARALLLSTACLGMQGCCCLSAQQLLLTIVMIHKHTCCSSSNVNLMMRTTYIESFPPVKFPSESEGYSVICAKIKCGRYEN
jgi:hypothetical protein